MPSPRSPRRGEVWQMRMGSGVKRLATAFWRTLWPIYSSETGPRDPRRRGRQGGSRRRGGGRSWRRVSAWWRSLAELRRLPGRTRRSYWRSSSPAPLPGPRPTPPTSTLPTSLVTSSGPQTPRLPLPSPPLLTTISRKYSAPDSTTASTRSDTFIVHHSIHISYIIYRHHPRKTCFKQKVFI